MIIIIDDDIPPTASDPSPIELYDIANIPNPDVNVVIDEADNCAIPTVAFISEVSNNYFQLIDYKSRLEISQNTLALRDSTLQIIQARFNEGYTNIIDVNQAQIQNLFLWSIFVVFLWEDSFSKDDQQH